MPGLYLQAWSLSLGSMNVKFLLALAPLAHTNFIYFTQRHSPGTLACVSQCFLQPSLPFNWCFTKMAYSLYLTLVETSTIPCYHFHFTAEMKWFPQRFYRVGRWDRSWI